MSTYDAWLTGPYDDEIDWADMGVECPNCKSDALEQLDSISTTEECEVRLWCADCDHEFDHKFDHKFEPQDCTPPRTQLQAL